MRPLKIAVLGIGNVGSGLLETYRLNRGKVDEQTGRTFEFKYILVNSIDKIRTLDLDGICLTTNFDEIVNDPEIDVIVELIGGLHPAYDYMKSALMAKKHVITANKAAVATYGEELRKLARENDVLLRYEASVCGGIPLLNTLSENLISNEFEELVGILNGTTNYILTRMTEEGLAFDDALRLAQEAGFAEADPSSDIEGDDSAYKLCILAHMAFGLTVDPKVIPKTGITKVSKEDIDYAAELGYKIKLLAAAHNQGETVDLRVNPALIKKDHPLASVNYEFNALFLKGNALGELMLYGKGAGSMPTGSSVLSDLIAISKGIPNFIERKREVHLESKNLLKYYIRLEVIDEPGVLGKVATMLGEQGISLDSVVQRARGNKIAPLVFLTHEIDKTTLDKAMNHVQKYDKIVEIANIMSVER